MRGSHGGPIVVTTLPSADVLLPKPQVGHARSLIVSGVKVYPPRSKAQFGSCQVFPTPKLHGYGKSEGGGGFHVESAPGGKLIIGLVRVGPITVHSSEATAVPNICR